jgi:hypothetical protein
MTSGACGAGFSPHIRSGNDCLSMLFRRTSRRADIAGNLLPENYRSGAIVTAERAGLAMSAWPRQMTTVCRIAGPVLFTGDGPLRPGGGLFHLPAYLARDE